MPPPARFASAASKKPGHGEDNRGSRTPRSAAPTPVAASSRSSSKRSQSGKFSRYSFFNAQGTGAVRKINDEFFDAISTDDIQQLFDVLEDKENSGLIAWRNFELFCREVLDPPFTESEVEAIHGFTDMRADGMVTVEEITTAFRSPVIKLQLAQMRQNYKVKKEFTVSQGVGAEVSRDLLVERLDWRIKRDDAFATLPFSSVFTVVFMSLVVTHLQIWNRQQVERGLESWMEGYGQTLPGPYLKQAVADTSSLWAWLSSSGLSSVFGECGSAASGAPLCRLATRNVLLGDAQLRQARGNGEDRAEWLLHSNQARQHLALWPGDYLGAANRTLQHLRNSSRGWIDEDTDSLQFVFSTYNEHSQVFATTEVTVGFDSSGYVEPVVVASAVIVDPYPSLAIYLLDAVYVCCILYPLYGELRDLTRYCRTMGCLKGMIDYIGFWNAVDWMNIAMGIVQIGNWIQCLLAISAKPIQELLQGEIHRRRLIPHVMDLDTRALESVRDELADVIQLFFWLHVIMASNVFIIMLKFFKAFQANPKLQLVTNTLANAANDIFHFCVVALAVFIGYSVIGHILFGGDIVSFNHLQRSMNTAFTVLMGDFGWYVEESESDVRLGSGVPWGLVVVWFWSFMVLNYLILTNMLMAIILEHYADCFAKVKANPDTCALWVQAWRYLKQMRSSKGFVPLSHILGQLENKTKNAHPQQKVSEGSLTQAFGISPEQADFLMDWLGKEATKRMMDAEGGQDKQLARLIQVEGFLEGMAEILRIVSLNVSQCNKSLQEMQLSNAIPVDEQDAARLGEDANGTGAELAQQLRVQGATVEELIEVASVLRDVVAEMGGDTIDPEPTVDKLALAQPVGSQDLGSQSSALACCTVQRAAKR